MPDKYKYYRLESEHEEVFRDEEPVSIYKLLFVVEAPDYISGINIWQHCDYLEMKDVHQKVGRISKGELECARAYPFYDLFSSLWKNDISSPIIFERDKGKLYCLEGRHRFRLLNLFYQVNKEEFDKRIRYIPAVIVKFVEERKEPGHPEGFDEWQKWLSDNNVIAESTRMNETYAKFISVE